MENLCETCVHWKPRNTMNCQIQQSLHINDILKEIKTIVIECKKYDGKKQ